ncbi:MAG: hypothetical protein RLZZ628_2457 [Bacteroidota bacterium]
MMLLEFLNLNFNTDTQIGLSLGSVLAIVCSMKRNHSILWAIIHAFLGWIYVVYYVLTR